MFTGFAMFAMLIQLALVIGIIAFAVKLVTRLSEIAEAQKSMAESQAQLVNLLMDQQKQS